MCLGSPSAPVPPAQAPEAARAPVTPSRRTGVDDATRRRRAGGVGEGTILTGSRGIQDGGTTAVKTLLGQ
jgi:hypothetical protein